MHATNHREFLTLVTNAIAAFKTALGNYKVYYQTSTIIESDHAVNEYILLPYNM